MHWFHLSPVMKALQFYILVVVGGYGRTHVCCGALVEVRISSLLLYVAPSDQTQVIKLGTKWPVPTEPSI